MTPRTGFIGFAVVMIREMHVQKRQLKLAPIRLVVKPK